MPSSVNAVLAASAEVEQLRLVVIALFVGTILLAIRLWQGGWRQSPNRLGHCLLSMLACMAGLSPSAGEGATMLAGVVSAASLAVPVLLLKAAARPGSLGAACASLARCCWWGASGRVFILAANAHRLIAMGELDAARSLIVAQSPSELPAGPRQQLLQAEAALAALQGHWPAVVALTNDMPLSPKLAVWRARGLAEVGQPVEALDLLSRVLGHPFAPKHASAIYEAEIIALSRAGANAELQIALEQGMPAAAPRDTPHTKHWISHSHPAPASPRVQEAAKFYRARVDAVRPWFRFSAPQPTPWITRSLAALLVAAMLPALLWQQAAHWMLINLGSNGVLMVEHREWWRLLTANFVHAGLPHLAFNVLALLLFGAPVERGWGRKAVAATFVWAGALGHLGSALWDWNARRLSVGASTAVYGLLALYALSFIRFRAAGLERFFRARLVTLAVLVAADIAISSSQPRIDTAGHLAGLIAGLALGFVLMLARPARR